MFNERAKEFYLLPEKQYEEMKSFYKKLGYSKEQVKKLSKKCFGAEIRMGGDESDPYNWRFQMRREYPTAPYPETGTPRGGPISALGSIFKSMTNNHSVSMMSAMPSVRSAAPTDGMAGMELEEDAACEPEFMDFMQAPAVQRSAAMSTNAYSGAASKSVSRQDINIYNTAETHIAAENEVHSPLDNPQLIFSANVNTASWSHLRSSICRKHRYIDKDFVRIEEIINSYPYNLKTPDNDELFKISAETAECPWNKGSELLFMGLKGKKADTNVKQNITLLVDVSGSMEDQWVLVQMSMAAIISKLKKGDILSIITYSSNTRTIAQQIDCGNIDKCVDAILAIEETGGWTHGSDGLERAYNYLSENFDEAANNRVFIFTDGDFNFGLTSEGSLKDFIYKKRDTGIYLSVVGYGEQNFKDDKMETLAQNGNGNYTFVSNPNDILDNLWDKLISNLVTVAKDVKISVEFNPKYVSEYRLIGYDFRRLTQKEFHDTKKAVDGIGSEHNVAALIELKRGKAEQVYSSRYVKASTEDNNDEFAFVEIHYKDPTGENLVMTKAITIDELNNSKPVNMPIVTMLAAFGLLVKDSEYKGSADIKMLSEMLGEFDRDEKLDTSEEYSHFDIIRRYVNQLD